MLKGSAFRDMSVYRGNCARTRIGGLPLRKSTSDTKLDINYCFGTHLDDGFAVYVFTVGKVCIFETVVIVLYPKGT